MSVEMRSKRDDPRAAGFEVGHFCFAVEQQSTGPERTPEQRDAIGLTLERPCLVGGDTDDLARVSRDFLVPYSLQTRALKTSGGASSARRSFAAS